MDYKKKIEIPFGAFDSELEHQEINIPNGFKAVIDGNKIILTRAESEDEKIRKSLIILLQHFCKGYRVPGLEFPVSYKDMLVWLEKQGKQKPTRWSKEDEKIFGRICALIHSVAYKNYDVDEDGNECGEYANIKEWFKKLKDRVQPQITWKPSDEQMADLWNMLCECRPADHQLLQDIYYGLKKLRENKL